MNIIVTGGAGFIGSHLVDKLSETHKVTVIDNLSAGKLEYINPKVTFFKADLLTDSLDNIFRNQDLVFHIAANPDVKIGAKDTYIHLDQNIVVTHRVLETMRECKIKKIVFTSTSTVYGEAPTPTEENWGPLLPTSLYGASKLACEALISSYCYSFDFQAWIYRLANVIGPRSNHGVICDFISKLQKNSDELEILGNGEQIKSYIFIKDCVDGMLCGLRAQDMVNIYNLGSSDQSTVKQIALMVAAEMKLTPSYVFTGGIRGWTGDVPVMLLSTDKIRQLGWRNEFNSNEAIRATIIGLLQKNFGTTS